MRIRKCITDFEEEFFRCFHFSDEAFESFERMTYFVNCSMRKIPLNKLLFLLAGAILLLNFGLLVCYLFIEYKALIHSDSAAKVLLAKEIFDSGEFFPRDWNYVNGDLFVLFGHAPIVPLLYFMKPGFSVHAISGLIASTIMLVGFFLLLGMLKVKGTHRLLILAAVCAGFSGFTAENLYGQVSYGVVISITLFLVCLALKIIFDEKNNKLLLIHGSIFFLILFLVVLSNPVRAFVTYIAPMAFALLVYLYQMLREKTTIERKQKIYCLSLIVVLSIATAVPAHFSILERVNNIQGAGTPAWLSYEQSMTNILLIGKGLLAILGGAQTPGGKVISVLGIFEALRIVVAIATIALIPFAVSRTLKTGSPQNKFLSVYALTSFAVVMFVQIFTSVPDMSGPVNSSRYLVLSVLFLVLIVYIQPAIDFKFPMVSVIIFSLIGISSLMAYPVFFYSALNSKVYLDGVNERARRSDLVDFLKQNNLSYGYAGYWNAGLFSVLSSGDVLIRQVLINGGLPIPMRHLSSNTWFDPEKWNGRTFLMLTPDERKLVDWNALERRGLVVRQELHRNGFDIFVFDQNLANKLPGWSLSYENEMEFKVTAHSMRNIGKVVQPSRQDEAELVSEPNEVGALHFGPYIKIAPGKYEVTFDIDKFENNHDVVKIDVATSPRQVVLAQKMLSATNGHGEVLPFEVAKSETLEFRLWALGGQRVVFSGFSLRKVD